MPMMVEVRSFPTGAIRGEFECFAVQEAVTRGYPEARPTAAFGSNELRSERTQRVASAEQRSHILAGMSTPLL